MAFNHTFEKWSDFISADHRGLPTGEYEIRHGLPIRLYWEDRSSTVTTVVFVNGEETIPVAEILPLIASNVLVIEDPNIGLNGTYTTGWHLGNFKQPKLTHNVALIVRAFRGTGRIVFYGEGANAFPALLQNGMNNDARCVVVNPITDLSDKITEDFLREVWNTDSVHNVAIRASVVPMYSQRISNEVTIIQDSDDHDSVRSQLEPLRKEAHPKNVVEIVASSFGGSRLAGETVADFLNDSISTGSCLANTTQMNEVNTLLDQQQWKESLPPLTTWD